MPDRDAERESAAYKALSVTVRRELFHIIQRRGPTDVKELIELTGMKEPTIRHHLMVLERAELVRTAEAHEGSRGRPKMLVTTTNRHWALGFPKRQYLMMAEHLLEHIIEAEGQAAAASVMREIGRSVASHLIGEVLAKKGTDRIALEDIEAEILPVMDQMGSVVDLLDREGDTLKVQMRNCIFLELSQKHHAIVCRGHDAIFETLAEAMGDYKAKTISCLAGGEDRCVTCITPKP